MIMRDENTIWNISVILVFCLKQGASRSLILVTKYKYPKYVITWMILLTKYPKYLLVYYNIKTSKANQRFWELTKTNWSKKINIRNKIAYGKQTHEKQKGLTTHWSPGLYTNTTAHKTYYFQITDNWLRGHSCLFVSV
jgi:hypothetical protein